MADVASLVFDIDSSGAVGAAKALAGLNKYAAATATVSAKLETQFRKANGQFQSQIEYVAENERAIRQLAAAYNPVLDAQLRYAEVQKDLARAVQLGVISVDQQADALRVAATEMNAVATGNTRLVKSVSGVTRGMGDMTHQVQNASYQIGDFFVQVASGQNPMMALSQQLPQLLGGFGAIGAAAGAVTAILGAAWMVYGSGSDAAKTLTDANDALAASIARLNEINKNYTNEGVQALIDKYGVLDQQIMLLISKQREFAQNEAMALAMRAITSEASKLSEFMNEFSTAVTIGGSRMKGFLREFNLTFDQAILLRDAINDVNKATDVIGKSKALSNLTNVMKSVGMETENVYGELINAESQLRQLYNTSNESGWFASAISGAETLYNRIRDSVVEAAKLNLDAAGNPIPAGISASNKPKRAPSGVAGEDWGVAPEAKSSGGGGGRPKAELQAATKAYQSLRELMEQDTMFQVAEWEKRQAQLDLALNKKLITETKYAELSKQLKTLYFASEYEQNAINYQMSLEQLRQYKEQEYLTEQQYAAKKAQLQWEYTNQSLDLNSTQLGANLNGLSTYFGQANAAAGGGYAGLLKAQQSFAAASAFISAYSGAAQALSDPTLTTFQKIAAAGKVLTTGLGFVNAIKGSGSGGGGGGAGATSSSVATQARVEPEKTTLVRVNGPDWLVAIADDIMKQIYKETKNGRVVVAGYNG